MWESCAFVRVFAHVPVDARHHVFFDVCVRDPYCLFHCRLFIFSIALVSSRCNFAFSRLARIFCSFLGVWIPLLRFRFHTCVLWDHLPRGSLLWWSHSGSFVLCLLANRHHQHVGRLHLRPGHFPGPRHVFQSHFLLVPDRFLDLPIKFLATVVVVWSVAGPSPPSRSPLALSRGLGPRQQRLATLCFLWLRPRPSLEFGRPATPLSSRIRFVTSIVCPAISATIAPLGAARGPSSAPRWTSPWIQR